MRQRRIGWYRSPVSREELISLNRRSDGKGLLQAGGYLGLLACTGTAAVLSLGRLHRLVRDDLPHCPRGLVETWTQIAAIQKRQKTEPDYQFVAELPPPVSASS